MKMNTSKGGIAWVNVNAYTMEGCDARALEMLFIIKSTLISVSNGFYKNNTMVIYKENLPRTIEVGGNRGSYVS
jgi:hypothetical protein